MSTAYLEGTLEDLLNHVYIAIAWFMRNGENLGWGGRVFASKFFEVRFDLTLHLGKKDRFYGFQC